MSEITYVPQWILQIGGHTIALNSMTLIMSWLVMGILLVFAFMVSRSLKPVPGGLQLAGELIIKSMKDLVKDAIEDDYMKYFPLICSLFMFLLLCNFIGILPYCSEPTKDLNTTLGMGLLGFVIAHVAGIKKKGIKGYLKEYFQPIFFMMPLNVVGEIAKVVSISFRLFGNIMGGGIIIIVISSLCYSLFLPPLLYGFFGLFVGTVQAFVFTILTLVYISVQLH